MADVARGLQAQRLYRRAEGNAEGGIDHSVPVSCRAQTF